MFFHLMQQRTIQLAVLGDSSRELITLYRVVRDFPADLIIALRRLKEEYKTDPEDVYYRWRANIPDGPINQAARTIALNKTCFNGLYRLNRLGKFNVSHGRFKNPKIVDEENILTSSELLRSGTRLVHADFAQTVRNAGDGDVVYLDPPFVSDWQQFSNGDFYRLDVCFRELVKRGAIVILTTNTHDITRRLFAEWNILEVDSRQSLKAGQEPTKELIIVGYPE